MKTFFFGLGIGTAVGLLFAPQEGRRTRAELKERARIWLDGLQGSGTHDTGQQLELGEDIPDPVAEVLNTATQHDLRSVPGIGKATAKRIVENRPYETEEQVLEQEVLPEKTIEKVKEQLVEENDRDVA